MGRQVHPRAGCAVACRRCQLLGARYGAVAAAAARRGRFDGREIVAASALDETHRPQIVSDPPRTRTTDRAFYGLGWNVSYDEQARIRWSHSGGFSLGAATCVNVLPGERIGIVTLTNASPIGVPEAICRIFLDLVWPAKSNGIGWRCSEK